MSVKVTNKQYNSKMCFVCGLENKFGLKAEFFELENEELVAVFQPTEEHQSYPGRLHGGLAATILDETIGRVILNQGKEVWGVTIDFAVRYRRPIPLDQKVKVVARLTKVDRRTFEGSGEILNADGKVAVEGKGKYLKMDLDKISDDFDTESDEEWFVVAKDDDPTSFDV